MAAPWIPDGPEPIVIPNGTVGVPYSFNITPPPPPSSAMDPVHIRTSSAPPPPPFLPIPPPDFLTCGLTWQLNPGDVLNVYGTPTTPGTYQFMFQVYNVPDPPYPDPYSSRLFQITIDAPPNPPADPATLRYFDNANVVPAPQGVQAPFNDEPANVWLGWDAEYCRLCITNYNRTRIICCFQGNFPT